MSDREVREQLVEQMNALGRLVIGEPEASPRGGQFPQTADVVADVLKRLRAEVDRLRGVLGRIREMTSEEEGTNTLHKIEIAARAALGEQP